MSFIVDTMSAIVDNLSCIFHHVQQDEESEVRKRLKLARVENELSQQDLAKLVGVSRQTINLIESGNYNPTLKLCIAICRALGKTLDALFWPEEKNR